MSVPEDSPPPEADSWRKLAEDACLELAMGVVRDAEYSSLNDRLAALLAAEDPNPPVFHVRPVRKARRMSDRTVADLLARPREWRWVAVAANGKKLYGSTESYEHRSWAIEQAHSVADPMGATVVIEEG